ncbi:MAG: ribonuclease J [Alphaproteobacteria bacterium]
MARKSASELVYLPLGGAGEIGMNLYLYGTGPASDREWIMVDLGIGFSGDTYPGVDVVVPDLSFIEAQRDRLGGIVLTHAHEDHLGALADLWRRLRVPVYATPFTAEMLKSKLENAGLLDEVEVNVLPLDARFKLGSFDLEFVSVAHSIPEPSALIIRTKEGTVLHTGDWKIDAAPVIGAPSDMGPFTRLGEEGCDAMVCDSTNVFRDGASATETEIADSLTKIIKGAKQRVAVTTFSSNVGRILSLARAGQRAGREIVVVGRALHRVIGAARATGYLADAGQFLSEQAFGDIARKKVLIMVTGSQGEPRAALSRIAASNHPNVVLEEGDMVIFSSKTIPGNEASVGRIENQLARLGVEVIEANRHLVHVTGHPRRDELARMYECVRPKAAVPMHGEHRHLVEHAKFAKSMGVKNALVVPNGTMARLAPGAAKIIDEVPVGRLLRDGDILVPEADAGVRERRKLADAGAVFVSIVLDEQGAQADDAEIHLVGIPEFGRSGKDLGQVVERAVDKAIDKMSRARRRDADYVSEMVRRAARGALSREWGKRPICQVAVSVL